jgi:uncharacterized protein YerC
MHDNSFDVYRLDELRDKYGFGTIRKFKIFAPAGGNPFYSRLLNDLTKLRDLRLHARHDEWCRRRMTFYFRHFALLAGFDSVTAMSMTKEFNKGFSIPLTDTKLERQTHSAQKSFDQGKAYRYKLATLIDELGISSIEMRGMDLLVDKDIRLERRRARRRTLYGQRDIYGNTQKQAEMLEARARIGELVRQGLTQSEIAEETGYSISKVKRIRAELVACEPEQQELSFENEAVSGGSVFRPLYVCALTPRRILPDCRLVSVPETRVAVGTGRSPGG